MLLARAAAASGNNAYTIKWEPQEQSFQDDSKTFDLTQDKIMKMFESADFGKGVKYHVEDKMFCVTQTKKKEVFFDMNIKDDFLFFAEMQTLFYLYEKVKTFNELIHDEYVDLFTFGVSTIKGISQRYGSNSPKVDAAFYVLKNTIPKVSQLFNDLYNGEALVEIVGWREKRNQDESPSPQLINGVNNDRDGTIRFKRDTLLKNDARKNDKNHASCNDVYNEEFPTIFNISLWLMIILVLTVYAVSIVMWYMDPGRDSIIYRVTSQHIKSE
ncbi:renin receptor-like [Xenia sp. Carnegie-2017]|uniref:renin receptor-like n=1 Tax=Xenia sp. Carnegie-2017 TaxID=2897299 RepID=UPI001F046D22|nr:renin receptor-like [Xenia sp. Carnegie-2017]